MSVYRLISWVYARVPVSESRKKQIKDAVYSHLGGLFRGSNNYALWRERQSMLRGATLAPAPIVPTSEQWRAIVERRRSTTPEASIEGAPYVVVPVYRGRAETLACLHSVLHADPSSEIVVIDDASPDTALVRELSELAAEGLFRLDHNTQNLGFARTANLGMAIHPGRDVVLLNSDTEVYGDWLQRLAAHAHSTPEIATVTPLSNNATIASYPHPLRDNPMQLELDYEALDDLARSVNADAGVETPTAVGFCMYAKRACVDDVGPFDEEFADGYGEENEFCLRASARGWRHWIAGDVFVRHVGGVSFGRHAASKQRRALARLEERYPDYRAQVDSFVARDPLHAARMRLDAARLTRSRARHGATERSILFVSHGWGGGVEVHLDEMQRGLAAEGVGVYSLRPSPGASANEEPRSTVDLMGPDDALVTPSLHGLVLSGDSSPLVEALRALAITHIHVHHIAGFDQRATAVLPRLASELGCAYDVTLHDFVSFCPRLHLVDDEGHYCGEPDAVGCGECCGRLGSPFGAVSIADWRDRSRALLVGARRVFAPSHDTAARIARHFPEVPSVVRPHPERAHARVPAARKRAAGEPLRVAVLGTIEPRKGLELLLACAREVKRRGSEIELHVIGATSDDARARRAGLEVHGRFSPEDADGVLSRSGCHVAFFPSTTPETWSYTLSSALRVRVFPVAFDRGALAERIRDVGWGALLACELAHDPGAVVERLLALEPTPPPADLDTALPSDRYASLVRDYYDDFS